jgi:lipopolysaccharide/colanic/teichoic acid biosynthesis glycosyltransferase
MPLSDERPTLPELQLEADTVEVPHWRPVPFWKRASDIALAGLLLIPAVPVMALAGLAVWVSSPGPVIYSQVRTGRNRVPFTMYKLRSMTHNCEAKTGATWSTKNDNRVTLVGKLLRKTHIDELPQLWNILRGEMSLVGPRPERPELIEKLEPQVAGYAKRLEVNPGLTGLAQVQLPPDEDIESVRRKIKYDRHYVDVASLSLDLRLIAATFLHVIGMPFAICRLLFAIPSASVIEPTTPALEMPSSILAHAQQA